MPGLVDLGMAARSAPVLSQSGLLRPYLPDQVLGMGLALRRYGLSIASMYAVGAARSSRRLALVDEPDHPDVGDDRLAQRGSLIEVDHVTMLAAVPVMLQWIMDIPASIRSAYDTSSRRVVVSGSAIPAKLATRFMDAFGDVLYNLYGSTEVAWVSVASPADVRIAPPPPADPRRAP